MKELFEKLAIKGYDATYGTALLHKYGWVMWACSPLYNYPDINKKALEDALVEVDFWKPNSFPESFIKPLDIGISEYVMEYINGFEYFKKYCSLKAGVPGL